MRLFWHFILFLCISTFCAQAQNAAHKPDSCSFSCSTKLSEQNCNFEITGSCAFKFTEVTFYNRWGQMLFKTEDASELKIAGKKLKVKKGDTVYYVVSLSTKYDNNADSEKTLNGYCTITD